MTGSRTRSACALAVFAAALSIASPGARADDPEASFPQRRVGLLIAGDSLQATFSYRDVFTPQIRKKMTSGLPTRLLVHVAVEPSTGGEPVAYWARSAEIVYDLWDEEFAITVSDMQGKRRTRVATLEQAIEATAILWRAPVTEIGSLEPGMYRLRVIVEVNPVSEEMVRNIQRWISRPKGGRGDSEPRTNFFGAFVGHFVDRGIGRAERVVGFVSQWFKLGPP
jgi:hypothetical protein